MLLLTFSSFLTRSSFIIWLFLTVLIWTLLLIALLFFISFYAADKHTGVYRTSFKKFALWGSFMYLFSDAINHLLSCSRKVHWGLQHSGKYLCRKASSHGYDCTCESTPLWSILTSKDLRGSADNTCFLNIFVRRHWAMAMNAHIGLSSLFSCAHEQQP